MSEIYKYNISGEASYDYRDYDWKSKYEYDEDALYSPSMKVSYFDTNIEKIDIDTLKNIMKENLKEGISNDEVIGKHFTNDFRIGYFDNKILCLEEYVESFGGGPHAYEWYNYTILSLETGKKLNNNFDLYKDLVDYSEEFAEFFKKEFIEYHGYLWNYELRHYTPIPSEGYSPFIFNNDGTITIYIDGLSEAERSLRVVKIEMKELKPYVKKDSFYRYLFD